MTSQDAENIFEALFMAFPGFREWLNGTRYPAETLTEWRGMIVDLDADHCYEAIQKMKLGELELPAAYERDRLPIKVRSYARRIAQDVAKQQADQNVRELTRQRLKRREGDPFAYNLGTLLKQSREAGRKLAAGEITREENAAIVDELAAKAKLSKGAVFA